MKGNLLKFLACPACQGSFQSSGMLQGKDDMESGNLICDGCQTCYKITDHIPRFVSSATYTASFSFEWNKFRITQLDSANGRGESEERFQQSLDFPLSQLRGQLVLDVGCGTGRFTEVALKYGATVIGLDMSLAIDAVYKNMGSHNNAHFIQADIFRLPMREGIFDFIYSLGVLHHTPDPKAAFQRLVRFLKPGGKISVTLYSGYNKPYVISTTFWRRLMARIPPKFIYYLSHIAIPLYYFNKLPVIGKVLQGIFPISMHPNKEWRVLDTLDCYTPMFQSYHTHFEVFRWFKEVGLKDVAVLEPGISLIARK